LIRSGTVRIERAREMGFCPGVRRAIDIVERAARERGEVATLGPVVHNEQVVARLAGLGAVVAGMDQIGDRAVVIPSHGVGPVVSEELRRRKLQVVDATCPTVRKAQLAAKELAEAGFWVVVFGDGGHPEVQGILGWAGGRGVATLEEEAVEKLRRRHRRLGILSQTTQDARSFARFVMEVVEHALTGARELRLVNTICHATMRRQAAAVELAGVADVVLVVGGYESANTRHLAETCSALGVETHYIEGADELERCWFGGKHHIGVTAGASTPDVVIDEVILRVGQLT
jgi:4-hydroxy-3-methylbut-2-enyl diphosphate reductase